MKNTAITVLSTFTDDVLLDQNGVVLSKEDGGPAYFITRALRDAQIPFVCESNGRVTVEILVSPEGEFGKIPKAPSPCTLPANLPDWTIVSTVLNEWNVTAAATLPPHFCMDLQGYVRDGSQFGRKHNWPDAEVLAGKVFCMKGTKQEVGLLPSSVLASQRKRLLVVTDGAAGVDLYYKGRHTYIPVAPVKGLTDTIGAGDTFFAYLVAALYKGATPLAAAREAVTKTTLFLERKKG